MINQQEVDIMDNSSDSAPPHLTSTTMVTNHEENGKMNDSTTSKRPRCVIEDFTQCSKSHLWKLMMSFYDRKGPESWAKGIVPHFITSNTYIGRQYAKVLHGYIKDCLRQHSRISLNCNEPLYIIELGAGSGKFSYFMLKALDELQEDCDFPFTQIKYIMTDFAQSNFDFWANHPSLKPYFDTGRLDAAIFDAVKDDTIKLWKSGLVLSPQHTTGNPMIIIANYLFDTLYHDIFQIEKGIIKEGLVSVGSKQLEESDILNPDIITRLDNEYKYQPIDALSYYTTEEDGENAIILNRILQWYQLYYQHEEEGASLIFPIGALRTLFKLAKISHHRLFVISGDKGNNHPDQFIGLVDPHIAVHGSFSLMVNYHAIGAWFTSHTGGFCIHNPQDEASLKVSCFVLNNTTLDSDNTTTIAIANIKASLSNTVHTTINSTNATTANTVAAVDKNATATTTNDKNATATTTNDNTATVATTIVSTLDTIEHMNEEIVTTSDITWRSKEFFIVKDQNRSQPFISLRHIFYENIILFGPNDFFMLQKSLQEDMGTIPLRTTIAILKLSDWDPDIFFKFRDSILNNAPTCSIKLKNDLCRGIPRVWQNYYQLDHEKDIAFEIGRFYYGIKQFQDALQYYMISLHTIGEHHVTYHNIGLCYYGAHDYVQAIEHFNKAYILDNNYEKARNWRDKVVKEMTVTAAAAATINSADTTSTPTTTVHANTTDIPATTTDISTTINVNQNGNIPTATNTVENQQVVSIVANNELTSHSTYIPFNSTNTTTGIYTNGHIKLSAVETHELSSLNSTELSQDSQVSDTMSNGITKVSTIFDTNVSTTSDLNENLNTTETTYNSSSVTMSDNSSVSTTMSNLDNSNGHFTKVSSTLSNTNITSTTTTTSDLCTSIQSLSIEEEH